MESDKINGKKKLPSMPSNYVTLVQLQERWMKEREQKEKEDNQGPEKEEQVEERQVEERVNGEVDGRGSRKKGHSGRHDRKGGRRVVEWKPKEEETAVAFAVNESVGVEEKKGEKPKNKKKWNNKRKNKKEEKAGADDEGEGVVETAANAPLPASVDSDKGKEDEEEMITDKDHAPRQASAEKKNVEGRTEDRTSEIGRKLGGMSMNGEIRRGDYRQYRRQNGGFIHRGGSMEQSGSNYGKFGRRREPNHRNEGVVWVKKGEGSDGNVGGIQSSSCSAKELD